MESMLTPRQVSEILRVSLPTVRKLYRNGELEYRKLGHRTIRIYPSSIKDFLKRSKPPPVRDVPDCEPFEMPGG